MVAGVAWFVLDSHKRGVSIQALTDTEARYCLIARRAGRDFAPGDLVVVERLPGDGNTAWGVPSALASAETRPIDATNSQRNVALLRASWDILEEIVATFPAELRKGPRGGGRDRDEILASHHRSRAGICAQDRGTEQAVRDEGQERPQSDTRRDRSRAEQALHWRAPGFWWMERQLRDPAHSVACGRSHLGDRRSSKLIV